MFEQDQLIYDISTGISWGPELDGSQRTRFDGVGTAAYSAADNDFEDYYRLGYTIINSISVAQALEKANYRFSYSYLDNESIQPGSGYDRHNFSLRAQFGGGSAAIYPNVLSSVGIHCLSTPFPTLC